MTSTIFNSCSMVLSGSYAVTHAQIIELITNNGGTHTADITTTTTHLIITQDTFNHNGPKIRQARGTPGIKIVLYQWLTQSAREGVKLDETPFLIQPAPTLSDRRRMLQSQSKRDAEVPPSTGRVEEQYLGHQVEVPVHDPQAFTNGTWKVWCSPSGLIFDANLRKVDVTQNENKFFHLQLVKRDDEPEWRTYCCGGRMGTTGKNGIVGKKGTLEEARADFEKMFKQKTGLNWVERTETAREGRYRYVERDYKDLGSQPNNPKLDLPISQPPSSLKPEVQRVMKLIFKKEYFEATMTEMGFDLEKVPLGKISQRSLNQGYQCLKELGTLIANTDAQERETQQYADEVTRLTNTYYTIIPHAFGKSRPTLISGEKELKHELALVRNLGDAEIATKVLQDARAMVGNLNLLDKKFAALGIEMEPTDHESEEFTEISGYLLGSRGPTHNLNVKVEEVFRIERPGEAESFAEQYDPMDADRSLLWHGSRITNFAGILKEGLRIAPSEAPVNGYMFGKGIYFADMSSKSAQYCKAKDSDNIMLLLLCEVDLGDEWHVEKEANPHAEREMVAEGKKSVCGEGRVTHRDWKDARDFRQDLAEVSLPDTSKPPVRTSMPGYKLEYNEYIVYDPRQPPLLEQTIGDHFASVVSKFGDRTAVISRHQQARLSYDGLDRKSNALARGLQELGVKKGDRVAVSLGNNIEYATATYAVFKLGAVLVPLNPAFNAQQVIAALDHLQASHLIIGAETNLPRKPPRSNVPLLQQIIPNLQGRRIQSEAVPSMSQIIIVDNSYGRVDIGKTRPLVSYRDVLEVGTSNKPDLGENLAPDDVINIQFTSGTTSMPKAACLSHRSILNNGKSIGDRMLLTERDIVCCPPPLFHCFGSILGYMATATHGSAIVFPAEAFDPYATLKSVQEEKCTALYGVPTMFIADLELLQNGTVPYTGFEHLRTGIAAGSSIPAELMRKLHKILNLTELTICYGMTETSPVSAMTTTDDPIEKRIDSVGKPLPHVETKVVDPADRSKVLPIGSRGELAVSGYLVMEKYWGAPEKTAEVMLQDDMGKIWMHTGDEAEMDADGYLKITGRIKDIIIRGGENIHPLEIENCLLAHPRVAEVSVVGLPDERYGEVVAAFVIPVKGRELRAEEVRTWVAEKLSHHLVPKYVFWVDDYPKTASGKIQKFKLREDGMRYLREGRGMV